MWRRLVRVRETSGLTARAFFVFATPVDTRRGFDGLALEARQRLGVDPRSGALLPCLNRRCNRLKVLWFQSSGYCVLYKRAHGVRFVLPTSPPDTPGVRLDARGPRRPSAARWSSLIPPELPIVRGKAGPARLAFTVVMRWQNRLPFHRLECVFEREACA